MTTKTQVPAQDTTTPAAHHTTTTVDRRLLWKRRAPHGAVGALVIAAAATRLAADLTGDEAAVAAWTGASAFVIAVVAATTARRIVVDKKTLRRAYAFLTVGAVWLTTVTATSLTLGAVGILTAFGCGLSLHWWRTHPISTPTHEIRPTPEPQLPYVQRWIDNIAAPGGALPGTRLFNPEPVEGGTRFTCKLVPGKQDIATVRGVAGRIHTGLELDATDDLTIEKHPDLDVSHVRVTILRDSPVLARDNVWPGPSAYNPTTGKIDIGPFTDGDGYAQWQVYTSNSIWGGFLVGGQGSGKTRLMESIVMSVVASTPTVVWFADGHGETGASSKLLRDHADYFAGTADQMRVMLAGAHLVAAARFDDMLIDDLEGFTPTDERPGLIILIDECHKFFAEDDIQELASNLITEYRKVGITIIAATQSGSLDRAFGTGKHADALRGALLTGNGVVLRIKSGSIKDVLKLCFDPRDFPAVPGYGRMVDETRGAAFRGFRVTDTQLATVPQQMRWRSLSPAEGAAFGPDYTDRKNVRARARREALERRRKREAGVHIPPPVVSAPNGGQAAPQVVRELLENVTFPVWPSGPASEPKPLHDGHRKVLAAIRAGHTNPTAIEKAAGYSERQVFNLLKELVDVHGVVRKDARTRGTYLLAVDDEVAA